MRKIAQDEFWVSNISKKNVSLRDLALTIKANTSVNLLDQRHYKYTREQLEESAASGSLYKKGHFLKVRKQAPQKIVKSGLHLSKTPIINRIIARPHIPIEEPKYEELQISDERFADEMTDETE